MNLWTMIVAVIAIVFISGTYRTYLRARSSSNKNNAKLGDVAQRLNGVEKRLANLETIVLEREKQRTFDEAL